jgi:hypothetical protein
MNEKQLGEALLHWDASAGRPPGDPQQLIESVLRRDRRRVHFLAAATVMLWIIAAGGIPLFFAMFMLFICPKIDQLTHDVILRPPGSDPRSLAEVAHMLLLATSKLSIVLVTGSIISLLLAAVGTVMLVFAARRTTLRQVNANLAEIATRMRESGRGSSPSTP